MFILQRLKDRIYIVCTGQSLKNFNFNLLEGQRIIAVNDAYKFVPCSFECLVAIDYTFYLKELETLKLLNKKAYAIKDYFEDKMPKDTGLLKINYLHTTGISGIDYREYAIRHGYNSGYTALGVAIQLGAKDIRLLGMDLTGGYFYNRTENNKNKFNYVIDYINDFKKDLRPDIKVTNYSLISKIECFEKKDLKDILL